MRAKNIHTSMTYERFLYTILEQEAESRGLRVSNVVNEELTKLFKDKIQLLRLQEKTKYDR